MTVFCPTKVWKTNPYSSQLGVEVSEILPVLPLANKLVSLLSQISKRTFIGMAPPGCVVQKLPAITKLIIHAENS